MKRTRPRTTIPGWVLGLTVTLLAACGGSAAVPASTTTSAPASASSAPASASSSAPASSASSAPASSASTAPAGSGAPSSLTEAIQTALPYTGGKAGPADKSQPAVKLGLINQQGGVPTFPEGTAAAEAAVSFINDDLGGIQGHPLELVKCYIVSSEEDGQRCGEQMANDSSIQAVQLGLLVVGTGSIYNTVGTRKALIGLSPIGAQDLKATNVYFYSAGGFGQEPGTALFLAHDLKAKNVALVYDGGDPGAKAGAGVMTAVLKGLGVSVVAVPAQGPTD